MKQYIFYFFEYDKKGEISFQAKYTTKKVTPKRALELLKSSIKEHKSFGKPFVYKIEQDGLILGQKDLK
jgi:hypothetical protein